MRIALFTEVFLPKIDGITNRLGQTIRQCVAQGHEVLIFAPSGSVTSYEGCRVEPIAGVPFAPYPTVKCVLPSPRIGWELARFRPDVIHLVGPVTLGLWGLIWAKCLNIPTVASYHTDIPAYMPRYGFGWAVGLAWRFFRMVHNNSVINLCPSRQTQAQLHSKGIQPVGLWRGGVNLDLFSPRFADPVWKTQLLNQHGKSRLFLYVGRLSAEKDVHTLTRALDQAPEGHLLVVGDGPARAKLEDVFADYSVSFTGYLKGKELARAYASADLFLMPSRTETLGFVTLEAIASGTPVLAANAGGNRDTVQPGKTGLLYEDSDDLAANLSRLLQDRNLFAEMQTRCHSFREQVSWQKETSQLIEQYQKAIELYQAKPAQIRGTLRYRGYRALR